MRVNNVMKKMRMIEEAEVMSRSGYTAGKMKVLSNVKPFTKDELDWIVG